jgi:nucleoside-diphosphate-sugar epimerase
VYNLASGAETTIRQLAEQIVGLTGSQAPLDIRPRRDWDRSGKRFGSTEKSRRELDFAAEIGLRDGLARTVEWTKENLRLIERCIAKHDRTMRLCQLGHA